MARPGPRQWRASAAAEHRADTGHWTLDNEQVTEGDRPGTITIPAPASLGQTPGVTHHRQELRSGTYNSEPGAQEAVIVHSQ